VLLASGTKDIAASPALDKRYGGLLTKRSRILQSSLLRDQERASASHRRYPNKKTPALHIGRGDADLIHRALATAAEVLERRAKGLNGLADELPKRAAKLRRLAAKIAAGGVQ